MSKKCNNSIREPTNPSLVRYLFMTAMKRKPSLSLSIDNINLTRKKQVKSTRIATKLKSMAVILPTSSMTSRMRKTRIYTVRWKAANVIYRWHELTIHCTSNPCIKMSHRINSMRLTIRKRTAHTEHPIQKVITLPHSFKTTFPGDRNGEFNVKCAIN